MSSPARPAMVDVGAQEPSVPDRLVVEQLRAQLAAERDAGRDFAEAWATALDTVDTSWRRALNQTRDAWQASVRPPAELSERWRRSPRKCDSER